MPTFSVIWTRSSRGRGSEMVPKMDVTWTYFGGRFNAALTGKRNSCSQPQIYEFDLSRRDAGNARNKEHTDAQ